MPKGTVVIVPPMENKIRQELIWAVSTLESDREEMRQENGLSITPKYTKAVSKSEQLKPRQWQGWRDKEDTLHNSKIIRKYLARY